MFDDWKICPDIKTYKPSVQPKKMKIQNLFPESSENINSQQGLKLRQYEPNVQYGSGFRSFLIPNNLISNFFKSFDFSNFFGIKSEISQKYDLSFNKKQAFLTQV